MRRYSLNTKGALIGAAGALLSLAAIPAHAQGVPSGSYLDSCTHVQMYGGRLTADCRRADGSWARSALNGANGCRGIANMDGRLVCNGRGANEGWNRDRGYDQRSGDQEGYRGRQGYGSSEGYAPNGDYGYGRHGGYGNQPYYGR